MGEILCGVVKSAYDIINEDSIDLRRVLTQEEIGNIIQDPFEEQQILHGLVDLNETLHNALFMKRDDEWILSSSARKVMEEIRKESIRRSREDERFPKNTDEVLQRLSERFMDRMFERESLGVFGSDRIKALTKIFVSPGFIFKHADVGNRRFSKGFSDLEVVQSNQRYAVLEYTYLDPIDDLSCLFGKKSLITAGNMFGEGTTCIETRCSLRLKTDIVEGKYQALNLECVLEPNKDVYLQHRESGYREFLSTWEFAEEDTIDDILLAEKERKIIINPPKEEIILSDSFINRFGIDSNIVFENCWDNDLIIGKRVYGAKQDRYEIEWSYRFNPSKILYGLLGIGLDVPLYAFFINKLDFHSTLTLIGVPVITYLIGNYISYRKALADIQIQTGLFDLKLNELKRNGDELNKINEGYRATLALVTSLEKQAAIGTLNMAFDKYNSFHLEYRNYLKTKDKSHLDKSKEALKESRELMEQSIKFGLKGSPEDLEGLAFIYSLDVAIRPEDFARDTSTLKSEVTGKHRVTFLFADSFENLPSNVNQIWVKKEYNLRKGENFEDILHKAELERRVLDIIREKKLEYLLQGTDIDIKTPDIISLINLKEMEGINIERCFAYMESVPGESLLNIIENLKEDSSESTEQLIMQAVEITALTHAIVFNDVILKKKDKIGSLNSDEKEGFFKTEIENHFKEQRSKLSESDTEDLINNYGAISKSLAHSKIWGYVRDANLNNFNANLRGEITGNFDFEDGKILPLQYDLVKMLMHGNYLSFEQIERVIIEKYIPRYNFYAKKEGKQLIEDFEEFIFTFYNYVVQDALKRYNSYTNLAKSQINRLKDARDAVRVLKERFEQYYGDLEKKQLDSLETIFGRNIDIVDMHCHTFFSDSDVSIEDVFRDARKKEMEGLVITDHVHWTDWNNIKGMAEKYDLLTTTGVEVWCTYKGEEVHLLCYGFDSNNQYLIDAMLKGVEDQNERSKELIKIYKEKGIYKDQCGSLDFKKLKQEQKGFYLPKDVVAQKIAELSDADADGIAQELKSFNVRLNGASDLPDMVSLMNNAGGKVVIAHPGKIERSVLEEILILFKKDILGIEAYSGWHSTSQCWELSKLVQKYNLEVFAGSDYHGSRKPYIGMGCCGISGEKFRTLFLPE